MSHLEEESRPLLQGVPRPNSPENTQERRRHWGFHRLRQLRATVQHNWPVLRILAVAMLWGMGNYGGAPSYLDGLRAYTCAYHYSTHPGLLPSEPHPPLPRDRDRPCAVKGVESKVGVVVAATTMLSFVVSSLSMLFYGPRLSKWGRKPMLMISLLSNIINYLPFAVLPLGYPFGDIPSELSVSPKASMVLILICSFVVGLTGFAGLFLCVMRVMVVDVAPPTRRTVHLNWLISATLLGAFFGPLLAAWALDTSVRTKTVLVLQGLGMGANTDTDQHVPPPTVPGAPHMPSKHGNPAALVSCCWVFLVAIVWTVFVVPETNPRLPALASENSAEQDEQPSASARPPTMSAAMLQTSKALGPLAMYLPQTTKDGSKDYRLTWLALAGMFSNIGTNALQYIAIFAGYKFDFTPDAIGLLLGLIGATRAVWLIFIIPMVVVLLERTTRKPRTIAHLHKDELEAIAKLGLRNAGGNGSEDTATAAGAASGFAEDGDAVPSGKVIRAVVLWRTAIDIAIGKLSYAADIVGYLVVFFSASFSNAAAMISGTLFLSFGAGAGPAVASAAIAIIQDMKHAQHPSLDTALHASPTDDWLAALSISDNVVNGLSPLLLSLVYSLTIETALPSTCFLIPTLGYLLSFLLLSLAKTRA